MAEHTSKNKPPYKLFGILFLLVMVIAIINNIRKTDMTPLVVSDNAGVSFLETAGDSLICVFKDGQVAGWNWSGLPEQQANFSVRTNRVVLLDANRLAAVNETGKKILSVYSLPAGEKTKDISVGWDDQDVWPRTSFDKHVVALIRKNPANLAGNVLYEFLTIDIEKELTGIPVSLSIQADSDDFIDFAALMKMPFFMRRAVNKRVGRIAASRFGKRGELFGIATYEEDAGILQRGYFSG